MADCLIDKLCGFINLDKSGSNYLIGFLRHLGAWLLDGHPTMDGIGTAERNHRKTWNLPTRFLIFEVNDVLLRHTNSIYIAFLLLFGFGGLAKADLVMELSANKLSLVQGEEVVVNVFLKTHDGSTQSIAVLDYEVSAGPYDNSGKGGSFLSGVNAIFSKSPTAFDLSTPGIAYFTDFGRQDDGSGDESFNGTPRSVGTLRLSTASATPGNYQIQITFFESLKRTMLTGGNYRFDSVNSLIGPAISYSISPIPEPSSACLVGVTLLLWRNRRRLLA